MQTDGMSTTMRVSERTRERFARLADSTGRSMTQLIDEAADALERSLFFEELSSRYGQLRHDPDAWAAIEAERKAQGA